VRYLIAALMLCVSTIALASWTSTRHSSADWQCQNADGTVVSSHQRQDKAFESCVRASSADGVSRFVVGGTYRIDVTLPEPCPSCPTPEPCPECVEPEPCPAIPECPDCDICPVEPEPAPEPAPEPEPEPPPHHHHGNLPRIDLSTIPAPRVGSGEFLVRATNEQARPSDVGAVRTVCQRSHFNFDDSLVHPGASGASHLHMYFGNASADAYVVPDNILQIGNSTCRGGIANRSAYWVPAMIDTSDGAVMDIDLAHVYYKTGYRGVRPQDVQPIPPGLAMIVGDMNRTTEWQWGPFEFRCEGRRAFHIPECMAGEDLYVIIDFPQCWDGVNLYTRDQSHMRIANRGCPESHPVALPVITYTLVFPVPEGRNARDWRLSSDDYTNGPGGYSMHADWINGWMPGLPPVWTAEILNLRLSGGSHLIGGGQMMTQPW
jgi:hypothetical protein